jgi:ribosome-associated heat shock protein Hsp15
VAEEYASPSQRLDRWLWYARFFKSRSLAAKHCAGNKIRVNRQIASKASASVRVGDVLTFPQGRDIRVVRIIGLGSRRGPAVEAQALYEDLASPAGRTQDKKDTPASEATIRREPGSGRPTKRDRRRTDFLRGEFDD